MKIGVFALMLLSLSFLTNCEKKGEESLVKQKEKDINNLLLKNYRPQTIFNIPKTEVNRAKFPIIDMHSHPYVNTPELLDKWVTIMDEVGIEKTIILSYATGAKFDSIYHAYVSKYPSRFEVWCGFDYTGYDEPGFGPAAIAELERCHKVGATGIGELGDKGKGLFYSKPKAFGMHPDDPRMDPLWEKCGELNMPVNIHVAEPIWMYQPMDSTNDGMMNALNWRLDDQPGIIDNPGMLKILGNMVKKHPNTTFIACHFANQSHDLNSLGSLFDQFPNLYADISARFALTAAIPKFMAQFYEKYQDRLLYGTDMGYQKTMYRVTFRLLETNDEHFYDHDLSNYLWSFNGFGLNNEILEKVYRKNALRILKAETE